MEVKQKIKELVKIIYSPDKIYFEHKFVDLLDALMQCGNIDSKGMESTLLKVQEAYLKRDYVQLADILLYELQPKL